jgi:hypothetical protein
LPVIANAKTVDPRDSTSTAVIQLETAMGAAIGCYPDAAAVEVPRVRFAPVKTTADLLALRSDAYIITSEGRAELLPSRDGVPPKIELDGNYKLVDGLEAALANGIPSLKSCDSLRISGKVRFHPGTEFVGDIVIENQQPEPVFCPAGTFKNTTISL